MSSVGFISGEAKEQEQLREAWKSVNALLKNIENAEACLQNHNLKVTADHLHVAKWNVGEVKKAIKIIGQSKNKAEVNPAS
jgi:hypothetical protein